MSAGARDGRATTAAAGAGGTSAGARGGRATTAAAGAGGAATAASGVRHFGRYSSGSLIPSSARYTEKRDERERQCEQTTKETTINGIDMIDCGLTIQNEIVDGVLTLAQDVGIFNECPNGFRDVLHGLRTIHAERRVDNSSRLHVSPVSVVTEESRGKLLVDQLENDSLHRWICHVLRFAVWDHDFIGAIRASRQEDKSGVVCVNNLVSIHVDLADALNILRSTQQRVVQLELFDCFQLLKYF
jgi:hypothetical protein